MTLLETYLDDHMLTIRRRIDDIDMNLEVDSSGYVYVDGEEGDYGVIKYYRGGMLVATRHIHGGDIEDVEWTAYGKMLMKTELLRIISEL